MLRILEKRLLFSETQNVITGTGMLAVFAVSGLCILYSSMVFAGDETRVNPVTKSSSQTQQLYAKVGKEVITLDEYNASFQRTVRQKFYHGKPPEGELNAVHKKVADELISRQLLLQEAARRGLKPDEMVINRALEQYDQRYAGSAKWQQQRASLWPVLKKKLSDDDVLQQLQSRVREIPPPTDAQLKKYYQQNPEKFTEPMQQKLSLILLAVDPSSSNEVWNAAMKKSQLLVEKLHNGEDFANLARLYSADASSERGGDMGYIHREMLSEAAQKIVDELQPGEVSSAVRVLPGIAVLRLDDRKAEKLRAFNDVMARARKLWLRENSESAWALLKEKLRLDTPVTVYSRIRNTDNDV